MIARTAPIDQDFSLITLFPLTFLSNAFVLGGTMPSWLQGFVRANPISQLISAIRQLTNYGTVNHDFWLSMLGAVVIVAIFAPLTTRAHMRME